MTFFKQQDRRSVRTLKMCWCGCSFMSVKTGIIRICQKLCTIYCKNNKHANVRFFRTLKTLLASLQVNLPVLETQRFSNTERRVKDWKNNKEPLFQTQALYFLYCTYNCCTNDSWRKYILQYHKCKEKKNVKHMSILETCQTNYREIVAHFLEMCKVFCALKTWREPTEPIITSPLTSGLFC